jgi:hypothetical protein
MKKLFFLYILLFVSLVAKSQDVIIKKSGDEIKAKVIEIGVNEIKYKRYDFQDGPIYTIPKTDVVLVRYENGINEVITSGSGNNNSTTTPQTTTVEPEKESTKIDYVFGSYSQNGRYISRSRVINILSETKDTEIKGLLKKSKNKKTTGNIIALTVGLPLTVIGGLTTLAGVATVVENDTYYGSTNPDGPGIVTVGAVMTGTGLAILFSNIGFQARSRKMMDKAVAIYNSKYAR